jgi:hypothetical protein
LTKGRRSYNGQVIAVPDWRPERAPARADITLLRRRVLNTFHSHYAILNVLNGAQILQSEDLSTGLCPRLERPGEALEKRPFAAETVPVEVEQKYVVVTI